MALDTVAFRNWLNGFLLESDMEPDLFPWARQLSPEEHNWLCSDLAQLLAEPEETGEPLDVRELEEVLTEYAERAGWPGPLLDAALPTEAAAFRVEVRPQDLRTVRRAAQGVQKAVQELLTGFLAMTPHDPARLGTYKIKKLPDRSLYQIDLPDDYRLRYCVDRQEQVVYVVYLGPHPQGQADGRERSVRAMLQQRYSKRL
ncbi:MAG TPA: hypothetical protein VFB38_08255 [Chthonomonadaceae bacterium]|nr:hypothetical protein [Chthonomonadaceae bacterium]